MNIRGVLLLFFSLLFGFACVEGRGCGFTRSEKGGFPVMVERVRVKEISPILTITGKLIPSNKSVITYPYDVKIQEVYAAVGSHVKEGDPLFRISDEEISNNLNIARARKTELTRLIEKNNMILRGKEKLLEEGKVEQEEISRLEKEIQLNESELERVSAEISKFSYALDHVVAASPIAGVVTERNISTGEIAKAGQGIFTIANVNPIVVSFLLTPKQAEKIAIGSTIKVLVNEIGKVFDTRVNYISPELHRTGRTFEVWASLPNDDMLLKADMTVSMDLASGETERTYIIPISSVLSRASHPYVFTVRRSIAYKTPIVIGSIIGDEVEATGGLEETDIIVVKGAEELYNGAEVNIWR